MKKYFANLHNKDILRAAETIVTSGQMLLLCGPPASGKAAMLSYLAAKLGAKPPIPLHLTSAQDTRDLIGSYVMTNKPGDFRFILGPLAYAVQSGRWISIEEVTSISQDSILLLSSILSTRSLNIGSCQLSVHPDFRIYAKTTADPSLLSTTVKSMFYPLVLPPIDKHLSQILTNYCTENLCTILTYLYHQFEVNRLLRGIVSINDMVRWANRLTLDFKSGAIVLSKSFCEVSADLSPINLLALLDDNTRIIIIKNAWEAFILRYSKPQIREAFIDTLHKALNIHHDIVYSTLLKVQVDVRHDYTQKRLVVGRVSLPFYGTPDEHSIDSICKTHHTTRLLEIIMSSIRAQEPLLLIGPTGIGKTVCLQIIARALDKRLHVMNMSSQADATDLLGGYVPATLDHILKSLYEAITGNLGLYISIKKNKTFLTELHRSYAEKNVEKFLLHCESALAGIRQIIQKESDSDINSSQERRRLRRGTHENSLYFLNNLEGTLEQAVALHRVLNQDKKASITFKYQEGLLAQALVRGDWILIDEINLASYDLLDIISQLVNPEHSEIALPDKGFVAKNPSFRVFAAMNPGSDIGKKDLPPAIRRCFTEVNVEEMADEVDIVALAKSYLRMNDATISESDHQGFDPNIIYQLFTTLKVKSRTELATAAESKSPCFSLRSLCRALTFAYRFRASAGLRRSLYEGFMMAFGSMLSEASKWTVHTLLMDKLFNGNKEYLMNPFIIRPFETLDTTMVFRAPAKGELVSVEYRSVLAEHSLVSVEIPESTRKTDYVVTKSTRSYMTTISRAISAQLPILLEGSTSSGKTSLIKHIAKHFNRQVIRINNHEHTDLSEYLGSYQPDPITGQLVFRDGPLVVGIRKGHWVILDELNMASSEILEALNRLLDDNRELLIPETQEIVRPAPGFLLFATQNPSGSYAGRKMLSEAFQNRFIMVEFSDLSTEELKEILNNRATSCHLAPQYCEKLIKTIQAIRLQLGHRNNNAIIVNALVTLRDLFRIADRLPRSLEELAMSIFELIGERQRELADKKLVAEIIAKNLGLKNFSIELAEKEYATRIRPIQDMISRAIKLAPYGSASDFLTRFKDIVWTPSMIRLFALLFTSISNGESPLLVGVSGAGKTTSVELIAAILAQNLVQVNLHKHTESADFIGSLRPLRSREALHTRLSVLKSYAESDADVENIVNQEISRIETVLSTKLFEWEDGPVLTCMKRGCILLLDEISLADESVLERLNSVLETSRELTVAENSNMLEPVIAHTDFKIVATMNPAGDYGKKELSPAMRSRLTEFWMPHIRDTAEVELILSAKLKNTTVYALASQKGLDIVSLLVDFFAEMDKVVQSGLLGDVFTISIRDILAVCDYASDVTVTEDTNIAQVILDAVTLSILDGLPVRTQLGNTTVCREVKSSMKLYLSNRILSVKVTDIDSISGIKVILSCEDGVLRFFQESTKEVLASIPPGPQYDYMKALRRIEVFRLDSPTTVRNACKIAKALCFQRPILLEGDPGVGKSALVSALAEICGYPLVRINLSEQTDLSDLLGSDLPAEGGFHWVDGVLLKAVKQGAFILLDELNLANQTVLEGLNSLLDHRKSLFIPELVVSVKAPNTLRIFGTQNPRAQGGGRKGLPQSFVSRFLNVYIDILQDQDYDWILRSLFPTIPSYILDYTLDITKSLRAGIDSLQLGVSGGPWEINVRDMLRLCDFLTTTPSISQNPTLAHAMHYAHILLGYRFRTLEDDQYVRGILYRYDSSQATPQDIKSMEPYRQYTLRPLWTVTEDAVRIGSLTIPRVDPVFQQMIGINSTYSHPSCFLTTQLVALEALALAVTQNLSCILVGAPEVGKSSILRTLADVTRQPLIHIAASTATDVSDLIGAYEQVDVLHDLREIIRDIKLYIYSAEMKNTYSTTVFSEYLQDFTAFLDNEIENGVKTKEKLISIEYIVSTSTQMLLLKFINQFLPDIDSSGLAEHNFSLFCTELLQKEVTPSAGDLAPHMPTAHEISRNLASLYLSAQKNQTGRFVWRDSDLIKALERGYWVELTNANFCMPSVLDRLNSLLERGGGLDILEQGLEETRTIRIHPNFRLFITYAPTSDVSRALRNRSLEVSIDVQVPAYNIIDIVRFVYINEAFNEVFIDFTLIKLVSLTYYGLFLSVEEIFGIGFLLKWITLLISYQKRFPESSRDPSAIFSWAYISFSSVFIVSTLNIENHQRYVQVYKDVCSALLENTPLSDPRMEEAMSILNKLTLCAIQKLSIGNSLQHSLALLDLSSNLLSTDTTLEYILEPFTRSLGQLTICFAHALDFHHQAAFVVNLDNNVDIDSSYLLAPFNFGTENMLQYLAKGYINTVLKTDSALGLALQHITNFMPFYVTLINLFLNRKFVIGDSYLLLYLIEIAQNIASDPFDYSLVTIFYSLFELLMAFSVDASTKTYSLEQRQLLRALLDVILVDSYFEAMPRALRGYIRSLFATVSRNDSEMAWLSVRKNLSLARISVYCLPDLFPAFKSIISRLDLCVTPEGAFCLHDGLSDRVISGIYKDIFAAIIYISCRTGKLTENYDQKLAILRASENRIELVSPSLSANPHPTARALAQVRTIITFLSGESFCTQVSQTLKGWSNKDTVICLVALMFESLSFYHKNIEGPAYYLQGSLFSVIGNFVVKSLSTSAHLADIVQSQASSLLSSLLSNGDQFLSYTHQTIRSISSMLVELVYHALGKTPQLGGLQANSTATLITILETVLREHNPLLVLLDQSIADILELLKSVNFIQDSLFSDGICLSLMSLILYMLTSITNQRDPIVVTRYRGELYRKLAKLISNTIDDANLHSLFVFGEFDLSPDASIYTELHSTYERYLNIAEEHEAQLLVRSDDVDNTFFEDLSAQLTGLEGFETHIANILHTALKILTDIQDNEDLAHITTAFDGLYAGEQQLTTTIAALLPRFLNYNIENSYYLDVTIPIASSLISLRAGLSIVVLALHSHIRNHHNSIHALADSQGSQFTLPAILQIIQRTITGGGDEFLDLLCYDKFIQSIDHKNTCSTIPLYHLFTQSLARYASYSKEANGFISQLSLESILKPDRIASIAAQFEIQEAKNFRKYVDDHSLFKTRNQSSTADGADDEDELKQQIASLFPKSDEYFIRSDNVLEDPLKKDTNLAGKDYTDVYSTSFLTGMNAITAIGNCLLYMYTADTRPLLLQERYDNLLTILKSQTLHSHSSQPLVALQVAMQALSICANQAPLSVDSPYILTIDTDRTVYPLILGATMGLLSALTSRSPSVDYAKLNTGKTRRAIHCRDIYRTPYPFETAEFCNTILRKVVSRTKALLKEWPENVQLLDIMYVCDKISDLPILETPLVLFLTGAEVLVRHLETWDKGAPAVYKYVVDPNVPVPESITKTLTHLVVTWRRVELMSWNEFFPRVHSQFANMALTYWPELLIASLAHQRSVIQGEPSTKAFYSQVREFLYGSNIGEFPIRLNLLYSLSALISEIDELAEPQFVHSVHRNTTAAVLFALASETEMFCRYMQEDFTKETAQLHKRFEDQIRIFEWNERSSYTSWFSVQNSHRLCMKIIREYTEVLQRASRAIYMAYSATYDRIPLTLEVKETYHALSGVGLLDTASSEDLIGQFNYCIEQVRYGRKETETLKRNEKGRILMDILTVLKELLGCSLSAGFSLEQHSGWLASQLHLTSVHVVFELADCFSQSMYQRSNEVEPHDVEKMKRIINCLKYLLVELSDLYTELADLELLYEIIGSFTSYIFLSDKSITENILSLAILHTSAAFKLCISLQNFLKDLPASECNASPANLSAEISLFLESLAVESKAIIDQLKTFSSFSVITKRLINIPILPTEFFTKANGLFHYILKTLPQILRKLVNVKSGPSTSVFLTEHNKYFSKVKLAMDFVATHMPSHKTKTNAHFLVWPTFSFPMDFVGSEDFSIERLVQEAKRITDDHMLLFISTILKPALRSTTPHVIGLPTPPPELCAKLKAVKKDTQALADILSHFMIPLISSAIAIIRTGFHSQTNDNEKETENDNQSGLGLGDGTGEQNISKEAAKELCEDDLMGNQSEQDRGEQDQSENQNDGEDDNCIEMENDFGGLSDSMHEDIEEKDELEKEMGNDQGEALDERNFNQDDNSAEEYSDQQKKNKNNAKDTMEIGSQSRENTDNKNEEDDSSKKDPEEQNVDTQDEGSKENQGEDYNELDNENLSGQSDLNGPEGDDEPEDEEIIGEESQQLSDISDPDQEACAEEADDKEAPSMDEEVEEQEEHQAPVDIEDSEAIEEQDNLSNDEPVNASAQQKASEMENQMQTDINDEEKNLETSNVDAAETGANDQKQTQGNNEESSVENAEDQWDADEMSNSPGEGAESADLKEGNPDLSLKEFQRIWKERMSIFDNKDERTDAEKFDKMPLQANKSVEFDNSKMGRDGALGLSESVHKDITNRDFDNTNDNWDMKDIKYQDDKEHPTNEHVEASQGVDPEVTDEEDNEVVNDHDNTAQSHMRESTKDLLSIEGVAHDEVKAQIPLLDSYLQANQEDRAAAISRGQSMLTDLTKKTSSAAFSLAERLKIILEPTITSDLKGDFKTGKKLNLRRIIPFIASGFRKDKIWLRRSKPNKRVYQVLLAIDDSSSMTPIAMYALQAITLLFNACKFSEVGQLGVLSFGKNFNLLLPVSDQYNDLSLAQALGSLTFMQNETKVSDAISVASDYLDSVRFRSGTDSALQLLLMISDGRMKEKSGVARELRKCMGRGQLPVLIVLDTDSKSIMDIKSVSFTTDESGKRVVQTAMYLDDFPFQCYALLRRIEDLPGTLAAVIKRWIESVTLYNRA